MAMQISSRAFANGQQIPQRYTCDGKNVSPPLEWSGQPKGTKSFVVICEDPDAPSGTFIHWVVYDIDARAHELGEGASDVGKAGRNSFKQVGFGGPCPPNGDGPHRYVFHIYALDIDRIGESGLSRDDVWTAMRGHVLAEGQLMAKYQRAKSQSH